MKLGIVAQAAGLFAVTNIDDILLLSLFFARGAGHRGSARRITLGQYVGFAAILIIAVAAAFGATFLPESAIPYLGLLPLALGLKSAWQAWKHRDDKSENDTPETAEGGPRTLEVAAVTFANGGDNIGAYVPVFATAGLGGMSLSPWSSSPWWPCGASRAASSPPGRSSPRHSAGGGTCCSRWS